MGMVSDLRGVLESRGAGWRLTIAPPPGCLSWGRSNKAPTLDGFKQHSCVLSQSGDQTSEVSAMLPPRAPGRTLPASGGFWWPQASLGLWSHHPNLCLFQHTALFPLCGSTSLPPSCLLLPLIKTPDTPIQHALLLV